MKKRLQNKIAESRMALPISVVYGIMVWLMAGLIQEQWWIQFCCFAISVYLMAELNNQNLLIRIFSRMVSCVYIVLICTATFLFPSVLSAVMQLCTVASLFLLFHTYQDKQAAGYTYYAFLCIGLASCVDIRVLYYMPAFWLLMAWFVYSLSWRTFLASLLGLITPYWFILPWAVYHGELNVWVAHFAKLFDISTITLLNVSQIHFLGLLVVLGLMGGIHFYITSYLDKIRVRQLYYSFILLTVYSTLVVFLQPKCYDMVTGIMIISVSPLLAHFIALTHTRLSNIVFLVISVVILTLTVANLWITSSLF
jgi:hypothetical protein